MNIDQRPITSKARGICRYYTTKRGCLAGNTCKFLHTTEPPIDASGSRPPALTPYDKAKQCKYFANGYCKRGDRCWFLHYLGDEPTEAQTDHEVDPCSICLEGPSIYGLLVGCSHIFCINCIRKWRDPSGDDVENARKCPMCRTKSHYIIPSSRFWKEGQAGKTKAIDKYKESMSKVVCKYFAASQNHQRKPLCPFGNDCFYKHSNPDGTPYIMGHGIERSMQTWKHHARRNNHELSAFVIDEQIETQSTFAELMNMLDYVVAEVVDSTSQVSGRGANGRGRGRSRTRTRAGNRASSRVRMEIVSNVVNALRGQLDRLDVDTARNNGEGSTTQTITIPPPTDWDLVRFDDNRELATDSNDNERSSVQPFVFDAVTPAVWDMDEGGEGVDNGWGWNDFGIDTSNDADPNLTERLELLANHMLGSLRHIRGHDTESSPPPLEPIDVPQSPIAPIPADGGDGFLGNDGSGGPVLESMASDLASSEVTVSYAEELPPPPDEFRDADAEAQAVKEDSERAEDSLAGVPPFVTDGRGRVVWSNKDVPGPVL